MGRGTTSHLIWPLSLLVLAGCQTALAPERPAGGSAVVAEAAGWENVANDEDVVLLGRIGAVWSEAVEAARKGGFSKQVEAEGPLLEPAAALPRPAPSPGSYMCRVIRFGSRGARQPAFTAFKPFFCHVGVKDDQLSITKQTGSERPAGYLWDDGTRDRMVFLGSLALGNEDAPLSYGEDPARDMAGVFERVAPFRFRLVIPEPRGTSKLDVIELVPAPVQSE